LFGLPRDSATKTLFEIREKQLQGEKIRFRELLVLMAIRNNEKVVKNASDGHETAPGVDFTIETKFRLRRKKKEN